MATRKTEPHPTIESNPPLHVAARNGNIEAFKQHYHDAPQTIDHLDNDGQTPLYSALCHGDADFVAQIIDFIQQPTVCFNLTVQNIQANHSKDEISPLRWTYLHLACLIGNLDLVRYLIAQTATTEIHMDTKGHISPFADITLRDQLSHHDDATRVKKLNGKTALYIAIENDFIEVAKFLVAHRANIFVPTTKAEGGKTPIHLAIESDNIDLFDAMCQQQSNTDPRIPKGGALDFVAEPNIELKQLYAFAKQNNARQIIDRLHEKKPQLLADERAQSPIYSTTIPSNTPTTLDNTVDNSPVSPSHTSSSGLSTTDHQTHSPTIAPKPPKGTNDHSSPQSENNSYNANMLLTFYNGLCIVAGSALIVVSIIYANNIGIYVGSALVSKGIGVHLLVNQFGMFSNKKASEDSPEKTLLKDETASTLKGLPT
jgi:ankyrin repeat protein